MTDGLIDLDTDRAERFGFTSDLYDGYLWKTGSHIIISVISCHHKGRGHLSRLFDRIQGEGFGITVPTPFPHMQAILEAKGFKHSEEWDEDIGCPVDLWRLPAKAGAA